MNIIDTILETKFENFEPKKLIYRNFKQYDSDQFKLDIFTLAVKLETTHKPANLPTNQQNHPQTSQTTHKSPTNQPNHPQTNQIPNKSPTNQPKIASSFP